MSVNEENPICKEADIQKITSESSFKKDLKEDSIQQMDASQSPKKTPSLPSDDVCINQSEEMSDTSIKDELLKSIIVRSLILYITIVKQNILSVV